MIKFNLYTLMISLSLAYWNIHAQEFVYPVADFDNGKQLVIIHQKSLDDVEVWFFDQENKSMIKGISSFLVPANLRILPTKNGFSFIDQGFIKIKMFDKRSPKTITTYEPISLISSMNWIDDHTFYFTAREGDYYQTFKGDIESNIQRLSCEPIDFLYPAKIDDSWYCIKRTIDQQFKITLQSWNPIDFNQYQILPEKIILPLTDRSLCFLKMVSNQEGFYLQAPEFKSNHHDELYEFSCHHLVKNSSEWTSQELFNFTIPLRYIHGVDRLYESIEPFLPNYTIQDIIYYVSFNQENSRFELFEFYIPTKTVINLTDNFIKKNNMNAQLFAPYIFNSKIYCGIITDQTKKIDFTQDNFVFNLPSMNTKRKVLP